MKDRLLARVRERLGASQGRCPACSLGIGLREPTEEIKGRKYHRRCARYVRR